DGGGVEQSGASSSSTFPPLGNGEVARMRPRRRQPVPAPCRFFAVRQQVNRWKASRSDRSVLRLHMSCQRRAVVQPEFWPAPAGNDSRGVDVRIGAMNVLSRRVSDAATAQIRRWVLDAFPREPAGVDYDAPTGDPGWFGPDSVTWRIHSDFPGMLAGGLCALMLQLLHPRALAGV